MKEKEKFNCNCTPYYFEDYCGCACTPEICSDEGCGCGCLDDDELYNCSDCCNSFNVFD